MMRYARAFAWFTGKDKVDLDDLKTVLPYLLWHKIQPTERALTENQKYANDRIALVEGLTTKIETDYNEMVGSEAFKHYAAALESLRSGKIGEKILSENDIRNIMRNAIAKIGDVDKPWAITLATHIASEYNLRCNGVK